MATKKFTFDPDAGVAYGANLVITTGADFRQHFEVENLSPVPVVVASLVLALLFIFKAADFQSLVPCLLR